MVCSRSALTPPDIGGIFMPGALCRLEGVAVEADDVGVRCAVQLGVVLLYVFGEGGQIVGLVGDRVGDCPGGIAGGVEGAGVLRGPVDVHLAEVVVDVGYFRDALGCVCVCVSMSGVYNACTCLGTVSLIS